MITKIDLPLAVKESVISQKGESSLVFEQVTMEKLKTEMEKLDKTD